MALRPSDFAYYSPGIGALKDGALGALFPSAPVGSGTDYRIVEIRNRHATLTLTSPKAWLVASSGAAVAIAAATDSQTDASTLTYSAPATYAAGISLPSIPAGGSVYVAVRRVVGSTTASPQTARLYVAGTSLA